MALAERRGSGDLVLRAHARTIGELGPYFVERAWDEEGEALGYKRQHPSPDLLDNPEHEALYYRLPEDFQFGDAKNLCGGHPETTSRLVRRLVQLGLARKISHGQYRKEVFDAQAA